MPGSKTLAKVIMGKKTAQLFSDWIGSRRSFAASLYCRERVKTEKAVLFFHLCLYSRTTVDFSNRYSYDRALLMLNKQEFLRNVICGIIGITE